jgi:hypothetical protein
LPPARTIQPISKFAILAPLASPPIFYYTTIVNY